MALVWKLTALCLCGALLAALLGRESLPLAIGCVLLGLSLLLGSAGELTALWTELLSLTGLAPALFTPLLKAVAIAVIVRLAAALCRDAGQSALAALLETAGAFCSLTAALPLLEEVLALLKEWI